MMVTTRTALRAASFAVLLLVLLNSPVAGEVTTAVLPGDYADFAMHPETGDLAALSAETDEALLFRDADVEKEPAAKVRVGSTPCSVCFKQFGDQRVYAVVCSRDSHMYLIDAEKFELLEKVELAQSGVSNVTCSINPEDPFLYYNFGSGHDSAAGVVSLRDRRNHGVAFDDSMDCAISADGSVAYRRGPWSPSGFESLTRTTPLSAEKPAFARLFYDHESTAPYVPDPFNRYTAAGSGMYTVSLEQRVASLRFYPRCFFRARPVVVGTAAYDRFPGRPSEKRELALRAASYNTFSTIGDQVKVGLGQAKDEGSLPRGVTGQGDFKRVAKRSRLFADDKRQRVVYASRNALVYVPLEEFNLPDEPFLLAEFDGPQRLEMGKQHELSLVPKDDRVEIVFEDTPEGMEVEGSQVRWKPSRDQIGSADVAVTLKHGDIQRTLRYTLDVVFPSIELPFAPAGMAADAQTKRVVVWEGQQLDRFRRPSQAVSLPIDIAVVDLTAGKITAQRKLAEHVGRVVVTDTQVVVQTAGSMPKCEVLRIGDLERAKAIVASAPITDAHAVGKLLILETEAGTELYSAETFAKVRSFKSRASQVMRPIRRDDAADGAVMEEGLLVDGILYDFDMQPKLVVAPGNLPELPGADPRLKQAPYLTSLGSPSPETRMTYIPTDTGRTRLTTMPLPGTDVKVGLDRTLQQMQVPGSTHTWRTQLELALTASGGVDARQVIVRRMLHAQTARGMTVDRPVLQVAGRDALVAFGTDLYRWHVDMPTDAAAKPSRPRIVPRQSTMALSGEGKTLLQHTAEGGKKPLQFALLTPYEEAMSIDPATGKVTLDESKLLAEADKALETYITRSNRGEPYVDTARTTAVPMIEAATAILGRRPQGAPVAIPIRVDVSDATGASASLQYYVVAEVSGDPLMARLEQLDQQRQAKQAAAQRKPAARAGEPAEATAGSQNLADVNRRLEALEQRVDLLTRQLNALLKKMEEEEEE